MHNREANEKRLNKRIEIVKGLALKHQHNLGAFDTYKFDTHFESKVECIDCSAIAKVTSLVKSAGQISGLAIQATCDDCLTPGNPAHELINNGGVILF